MRINSWLFALIILAGLDASDPIHGKSIAYSQLVGHWIAIEPAEEDPFITKNGQSVRFKGRPAFTVTLDFKSDNRASLTIKDGESSIIRLFTYRIINSSLVECLYSQSEKPERKTVTIAKNKLWLAPYPLPKRPQESIDILYTLTFVKQP